jgi:hypothetical protein
MAAEDPKEVKVFETMDDMLAAPDVEYAIIEGWSGAIRIGSLTAGDMIEWSEANEGEAKRTAGLRLIVKSIVNSQGQRIGNDKHIPMLRAKSHKVTEKVVREILRLNGMNVKADEPKKD